MTIRRNKTKQNEELKSQLSEKDKIISELNEELFNLKQQFSNPNSHESFLETVQ
jgi:predicted RNase H-like nuclease (RuvC/YqgF family)